MESSSTINTIGHYCGRFGPGIFGEPLNSFTNSAYVIGALYTWRRWKSADNQDKWQLPLFLLAGCIGIGSFIFHSAPSPVTLQIDLFPVQLFGLTVLAYVSFRYFHLSAMQVAALLVSFFVVRQFWIHATPRGALGGGITHIPTIVVLGTAAFLLIVRKHGLGKYLVAATITYLAAIVVRSFDLQLCGSFPIGVHWLWHLLGAVTSTLVLYGIAEQPPNQAL
jgi:hypothetical protein